MNTNVPPRYFPNVTFAHAVSLGANCEPAHFLRLHGRYSVKGVFDWLVTPLGSIAEVLSDQGARLGLSFVASHEGTSVRCGAYGVLYHHEFPRSEGDLVRFDLEALERCRSKMRHKMDALTAACEAGGPILFLRFGPESDLPWDRLRVGRRLVSASDLGGLVQAVDRRFPGLDFRLLTVTTAPGGIAEDATRLDPRIAVHIAARDGRDGWVLSAATWAGILDRVRFSTPAEQLQAVGETLHWFGADDPPAPPAEPQLPPTEEISRMIANLAAARRLSAAAASLETGGEGRGDALEAVQAALGDEALPPLLRQQAGRILLACGQPEHALAALLRAAAEAPGLPRIGLELAGAYEAKGALEDAAAWSRLEIAAAPLQEEAYDRLARLLVAQGRSEDALGVFAVALDHGLLSTEAAAEEGHRLWLGGRAHDAVGWMALAHRHGLRSQAFLQAYFGLLTGEARYAEVIELAAALRREDPAGPAWPAQVGHAKLALAQDRARQIALAEARSRSASWLDAEGLLDRVSQAIAARRPFAFIRVGDGEARFLIAAEADDAGPISAEQADALGEVVWRNWFGRPWSTVQAPARAGLSAALADAVRQADVVGTSDDARLRQDTGHYGYLAWQEDWLRRIDRAEPDAAWTSALIPRDLHLASPFLERALAGLDFLGVIGPHPNLAEALKARLGVGRVESHLIPAEGRLPAAIEGQAAAPHFPDVYEGLLSTLSAPRPGAVFLVAGGLLGKIYCARIKALGGIALDIGALADAWMGHDTRSGQMAEVDTLESPLKAEPGPIARAPCDTTLISLSLGKTSSMALAAALRDTGVGETVHLHYLGPQALALKRLTPEPMLDVAIRIRALIERPGGRFRIVTCVRDPIARAISQVFQNAPAHLAATGVDITRDPQAVIDWFEDRFGGDITTRWFDDTFKKTFNVDFRNHSFDRDRMSLRFENDRLRWIVLRQEDASAGKEAELGWLLERDRVQLPVVNDAASRPDADQYRAMLAEFVAPRSWLEAFYDTEANRHFYTADERSRMRARWSSPAVSQRSAQESTAG